MFSRTKSVGRLARSVEMMTQRPTIGSFLSSGNYGFLSAGVRKLCILRRERGVAENLDLRAVRESVIVYGDDIESPLARWWKSLAILASNLGDLAPLVP